jgi:SulP family sulfate permease
VGRDLADDVWGGLAAALVALPSAVAFGVAVYAPLGDAGPAQGALAGLVGAAVVGLVAPLFGGAPRLVSAPCAPAAAVLGALSTQLAGVRDPGQVTALLLAVGVACGALQLAYGALGGGTLIKYIPYPVVTGYLTGVGVVILLKQLPGFLGLPHGVALGQGLRQPWLWDPVALVVGAATAGFMLLGPTLTQRVPGAILGVAAGLLTYAGLAVPRAELRVLEANRLLIGPLLGGDGSLTDVLSGGLRALSSLSAADLAIVLAPALTLSALLSIDTLKTCVVVDALTASRHDSNREIRGQGLANLATSLFGGMPGAGTSGATLVNLASGGCTRRSGVLAGAFALAAALLLPRVLGYLPIAALSGVLLVVAWRMLDRNSLRLLRQRSTLLDFVVVASVVAVAVGVGLIEASATGVGLAILLFIRDQVRGTVVHRRTAGNQVFSRQRRLPEQLEALARRGAETVVYELEGNLFFGTTDQLLRELEPDLASRRFVILDFRRVRSLDLTAAHLLEQIQGRLAKRGAHLLFSNVPRSLPTGQDLRAYFDEVGLARGPAVRVFTQLSDALEWAEDRLLEEDGRLQGSEEPPLLLREIGFLRGRKQETLQALEQAVEARHFSAGERIFGQGEPGDAIFFVRRGTVRIALRLDDGAERDLVTLGRGDFFGDMAFLDEQTRSAGAVARTDVDLYVLPRERFEHLAEQHPRLGRHFYEGLALALARRLRHADAEIRVLEEA